MSTAAAPTFFFNRIDSISEAELDSKPYGVIQLDGEGRVLRYNAFESQLSGLNQQKVIGKNFFTQIAPCTGVQEFYGRFKEGMAAGKLHCTFRFYFPFKRRPCDVTITLFYNSRDKTMWVMVQPLEHQEQARKN